MVAANLPSALPVTQALKAYGGNHDNVITRALCQGPHNDGAVALQIVSQAMRAKTIEPPLPYAISNVEISPTWRLRRPMEDLSAWAATKGETGHRHEEKETKIDDEDVNNNLAGFTMHDLDLQ